MTAWRMISRASHKECVRKHVSRIVIPSEAEGSFSLAVRWRMFEKEKWETPYRGRAVLPLEGLAKEEGRGAKKISRCARNDSVGNGYPDDSVEKMDTCGIV